MTFPEHSTAVHRQLSADEARWRAFIRLMVWRGVLRITRRGT